MKNILFSLLILLILSGCISQPTVTEISPENDTTDFKGVRAAKILPYEIFVYSVDEDKRLALKLHTTELLPDPYNIYIVNYSGAFVSSSSFSLELNSVGGIKKVHLETTRTLEAAGKAGTELIPEVVSDSKADADNISEILSYRKNYDDARVIPPAPGEPKLLDGSSLPYQPNNSATGN